MFWIDVATRWLHVLAAVAGLGGILFLAWSLAPALRDAGGAPEVAEAAQRRFKRISHAAIGLLLLTGFYNYLWVAVPKLRGTAVAGTYHMVMGTKILLSLVLFTLVILLLAPMPAMQTKRAQWLTTNAILGLLILALAAYLRRLWP